MSRPSLSSSSNTPADLNSGVWIAKTPSEPRPDGSIKPPQRRLRLSLHCDAALSWGKLVLIALALAGMIFYIAQRDEAAIQEAIQNAETRVLQSALAGARRAPPGVRRSKLAQRIGDKNLKQHEFNDHYLCGSVENIRLDEVASKSLALAVVTYRAPKSLAHSMKTWYKTGLLEMAEEKFIFINSPSQEDMDIANSYGFTIFTTTEQGGNIMAGPSLAYLVGNSSTSDYILFLEKDFEVMTSEAVLLEELWTGFEHLARGVDVYRLRGKRDHPAEGMPDCCQRPEKSCPFNSNWRSSGGFGDHMNWLFIYCDPDILKNANGRVAKCTDDPPSYCYTSQDTNWTNNPVLFPRKWFQKKVRDIALNSEKVWEDNRMFEFNTMLHWLQWHPPARVCSSYWGAFKHHEIDQ